MTAPAAYRHLRNGLLWRLAVAAAAFAAAATAAMMLGASAPQSPPADPQPRIAAAAAASTAAAALAAQYGTSAAPAADAAALAAMYQVASLPGKDFEVIHRRSAGEAEGTGGEAAGEGMAKPSAAPTKLPRGPHLQAGIFLQTANAEELKKKLEADGFPAYIETRVQVGPFPNRKEADRARDKLKEAGLTTVFIPQ
jgi:DedD protein